MRAPKLLILAGAILLTTILAACSDDKAPTPPEVRTIDPIENLSFGRVDPTMISLTWSSPAIRCGCPREQPAFYELLYQVIDTPATSPAEVQIHTCDMATHSSGCPECYILDGLSPNTNYRMWVRAVDETGVRSPESNTIEISTPVHPEPVDPKIHPILTR